VQAGCVHFRRWPFRCRVYLRSCWTNDGETPPWNGLCNRGRSKRYGCRESVEQSEPPQLFPIGKSSKWARRLHENLWLLRSTDFFEGQTRSLDWLRSRLGELRREFDYAVIHAPAVGACGETGLLGQIADGVILVLDERRTRRATAREAKAVLQAANARLLGVVINERQFPIPESIYRKL
jgi:hypothetical protein